MSGIKERERSQFFATELGVRQYALEQPPEARPVIELAEMTELVHDDIVRETLGQEDDSVIERQGSARRAAPPSCPLIAYRDRTGIESVLLAIPADPGLRKTGRLIAMQDETPPTLFPRKPRLPAGHPEALLRRLDPGPLPNDEALDKKKRYELGSRYGHLAVGSDRDTKRPETSSPPYTDHLPGILYCSY